MRFAIASRSRGWIAWVAAVGGGVATAAGSPAGFVVGEPTSAVDEAIVVPLDLTGPAGPSIWFAEVADVETRPRADVAHVVGDGNLPPTFTFADPHGMLAIASPSPTPAAMVPLPAALPASIAAVACLWIKMRGRRRL